MQKQRYLGEWMDSDPELQGLSVGEWMERQHTLQVSSTHFRATYANCIDTARSTGTESDTSNNTDTRLQELYEGRMASLERFVGFLVVFHTVMQIAL